MRRALLAIGAILLAPAAGARAQDAAFTATADPAAAPAPLTRLAIRAATALPEGAVVSASILRRLRAQDGTDTERWVNARRGRVVADGSAVVEFDFQDPLPAGRYKISVTFDAQRQTPSVRETAGAGGDLSTETAVEVGTPIEIELEMEWGAGKIWNAWDRLDAIRADLKSGAPPTPDDARARIAQTAGRLGRALSGSPVAQTLFPRGEEALGAYARALDAFASSPGPVEPAEAAAARAAAVRTVAEEFIQTTGTEESGWIAFVHQEFWINRSHQRLGEEGWAGFLAQQRERLDGIESTYRGWREPDEGASSPHTEVAALLPPAPIEICETLRAVLDNFENDRRGGLANPGPDSRRLVQSLPFRRR
ncbi:MAG: hypothetical protein HY608_08640 [Planctomycetes bacterium]|nr:hypothetical protein [Planctomycetota bacterium]